MLEIRKSIASALVHIWLASRGDQLYRWLIGAPTPIRYMLVSISHHSVNTDIGDHVRFVPYEPTGCSTSFSNWSHLSKLNLWFLTSIWIPSRLSTPYYDTQWTMDSPVLKTHPSQFINRCDRKWQISSFLYSHQGWCSYSSKKESA